MKNRKIYIALICLCLTLCCGIFAACDSSESHVHSYTETVSAPTCTERGFVLHKCECGYEYADNYTESLGHLFSEYVSDNNATCTEDGTKTAHCDRNGCGQTETVADEDSALGHLFTEYISNDDATCTEDGTKTAHCDRDGCVQVETVTDEDSALGHLFTEYISNGDATCTEDGTKTAHCDRDGCNATETVKDLESADGHKFAEGNCTVCGGIQNEGLNFFKSYTDESYILLNMGTCEDSDIIVPAYYKNLPVTEIGSGVFKDCKTLTSLTFGKNIKRIAGEAFSGAEIENIYYNGGIADWCEIAFGDGSANPLMSTENLYIGGKLIANDIEIPNTVKQIRNYAFIYHSSLKSVRIPASVKSIGEKSFLGCDVLTEVYFDGSLSDWCGIVFSSSTSLLINAEKFYINNELVKDVVIPNTVKTIKASAFESYEGLTSLIIPDSVTVIENSAFAYCSNLSSVEIGNNVVSIGQHAFSGTRLTSVKIPDSVKNLGNVVFSRCEFLYSVEIGNGVEKIGSHAFSGTRLHTVKIGSGVKSVGEHAFDYDASSLKVYYEGNAEEWKNIAVEKYNSNLINAAVYYYSANKPETEGDFWRYVDGELVIW